MKNLYNITDCAKELEQMNATIEAEKPSNKHFRIYRKYSNEIEIAINKRGAMQKDTII